MQQSLSDGGSTFVSADVACLEACAEQQWYVARIKPQSSKYACEHLARASITHRYPTFKTPDGEQALIPGYVFVQIPADDDMFAKVNDTFGIDHLLPIGHEEPRPLRKKEFARMIDSLEAGEFDEVEPGDAALPWFTKGEMLYVKSGLFAGRSGKFNRVWKGVVELQIEFFGQSVKVMLNGHQVQRSV